MIEMKRPNTADFNMSLMMGDELRNREMEDLILDERSKLGKSVKNILTK